MESCSIEDGRKKHLLPALSTSYKRHLHIVGGVGQYLISSSGERYLDCVNNVCHVGHCHPTVVEACVQQMRTLNTNTRYLHENIVNYASKLTQKTPPGLEVCVFTNSGSEANEAALRLARNFAKSDHVIVVDHGYHGNKITKRNTTALIGVSPYKYQDQGKGKVVPKPETTHVIPAPDVFRGKYNIHQGYTEEQLCDLYVQEVQKRVDFIESQGRKVGAFLHESILGCAGQIPFPEGFLKKAYHIIRSAGGVCIADEVQTGFGRCGEYFWAFELQQVVPDLIVMGKPIGNGFPLGGVITTMPIAKAFKTGIEYFNTFGGNPVACAVGLAVLEVIESEHLQQNALETGEYFKKEMRKLQENFPEIVGDVRGHGLFLGMELIKNGMEPAEHEASHIVNQLCQKYRICLSTDGPHENVIKIKPPMCFNKENVDYVVEKLGKELQAMRLQIQAKL